MDGPDSHRANALTRGDLLASLARLDATLTALLAEVRSMAVTLDRAESAEADRIGMAIAERSGASPVTPGGFLTVREVADLLRITPSTVYRMAKAGTFPQPLHLGANLTRWRADDYLTWLRRA